MKNYPWLFTWTRCAGGAPTTCTSCGQYSITGCPALSIPFFQWNGLLKFHPSMSAKFRHNPLWNGVQLNEQPITEILSHIRQHKRYISHGSNKVQDLAPQPPHISVSAAVCISFNSVCPWRCTSPSLHQQQNTPQRALSQIGHCFGTVWYNFFVNQNTPA